MDGFSSNVETVLERKIEVSEIRGRDDNFVTTYELDQCADWVKKGGYHKVCLQFPDEHLIDANSVALYLKSKTKSEMFILADTSYSSCCVDSVAARHVDADAIIHFGPSCLSPCLGIPVFYVYASEELNVDNLHKALVDITADNKNTVIFYETKYQKHLKLLKKAVCDLPSVVISELVESETNDPSLLCGRRIPESCEQCVYIGSDSMLLTNLSLILPDASWFIYENSQLREYPLRQNKFLMKRLHLVEKLKDAAAVGVLIGTLSVDGCLEAVNRVKTLCKKSGKKCYTVAVGRPNTAKLANFPEIDVFVLISCPENKLFVETSEYFQPIVSLLEVELAFGGRPWSTNYTLDFRLLQPGGKLFAQGVEQSEENVADISLVTGKLRNIGVAKNEESSETALMEKASGALVDSHGAKFLSSRSWAGLEPKLGETPVEKVSQGRRGIPLEYQDEGNK